MLPRITDHLGAGGRVLVAVRPPYSTGDIDYRLLGYLAASCAGVTRSELMPEAWESCWFLSVHAGQVSFADGVQRAQCLVENGDSVIKDWPKKQFCKRSMVVQTSVKGFNWKNAQGR